MSTRRIQRSPAAVHTPSRCTLLLPLLLLLQLIACHASAWGMPDAPPGRTAIKINVDQPVHSYSYGETTASGGTPYSRSSSASRHAAPLLYRQPNAVVPPPFLQPAAADPSVAKDSAHETVFASYYDAENADAYITGGSGVSSSSEGGSSSPDGSVSGSDPIAVAAAAAQADAPSGHLDEFGYPVASSSVSDGSAWGDAAVPWTRLDGSCWQFTTASYIYQFCPYQNVTQRSTATTLHVVMGVWDEWIETGQAPVMAGADTTDATAATSAADNYPPFSSLIQSFTDGTACGSGKRRSTRVLFVCESTASGESRISDVQEPATCEYTIQFHTPLVCPPGTPQTQTRSQEDRMRLDTMQTCISALWASQLPGAGDEARAAVIDPCRDYLPAEALSWMRASAAADVHSSAALSSLLGDDGHVGSDAAAAPSESVRANIPSSILVDDNGGAARSSTPSPSRAAVADDPLNGDFTPQASSSPYAQMDDREL